jgi:P4 family phage/plasmid primase-like protien
MSKMRRTRVSQALFKFAQTPNNQSEILKILQKSLVMSFVQMQKPYLLCCPNGLVDLREGKLMGKPKPNDFITDMCSTEYDPQADITPAVHFFERFFPLGAFPDQQALVRFFQQYLGYSLTLENNQQFCLCIYGGGSNGKSVLNKMLQLVLGNNICKVIPYESLLKARGQNNDALDDAKRARIVTMEEINDNGKEKEPNSATFKNLVSGDTITTKSMYKKAKNSTPVMKLVFMLNKLPKIYFTDYAVKRRLAVINFTSIFVDEQKAFDKQQADELRKRGAQECLIQVKDEMYFETHVRGHKQAFLRFLVEGAVAYYQTNHISIPASMQETAVAEASKPSGRLYAFFMQRLSPVDGASTALEDIEEAFFASVGDSVNRNTYTRPVLGKDLSKIIKDKRTISAEWRNAFSDQRSHPVTKERCTLWFNVKLLPPPQELPAAERFAPSNGAGS